MAHHDRIFKHATIVNQDGVHVADLAVTAGRISALGDLRADSASEIVDCLGLLFFVSFFFLLLLFFCCE